jgi:hypothetical protein
LFIKKKGQLQFSKDGGILDANLPFLLPQLLANGLHPNIAIWHLQILFVARTFM